MPPLENEELMIHVATWSEILLGAVPENRLADAYVRAMQDSDNTYTLTAPQLIQGFRSLCASERNALAQTTNLLSGDVCKKCFGSGLYVPEGKDAQGYKLPAQRCDHVPVEDPDDVSMF